MVMDVEFEISGRKIGWEYPPLVIAEIGINHDGSLEAAKKMVGLARMIWLRMYQASDAHCRR